MVEEIKDWWLSEQSVSAWDLLPESTKAAIDRDALMLGGVTMDQALKFSQKASKHESLSS